MDKIICYPALIYLVIASIMLCVGVILKLSTKDLAITFSQASCIIISTLILMGLCDIAPQISWVITTIFIICSLSVATSLALNWAATPLS